VADDGVRFLIDGQKVIEAWPSSSGQKHETDIVLETGVHAFVVEYTEISGEAYIHLWGEVLASE
jgi:hypothetical protein